MPPRVTIGIGIGWVAIVGIAIGWIAIAWVAIGWVAIGWVAIAGAVRPIHLYLIRVFISYIRMYLYNSV